MSNQQFTGAHFKRLLDRIDDLEERVEELESGGSTASSGSSGWGDSRDQAVLAKLEVGEGYDPGHLRQLYKSETDIKNKSTLKSRVTDLKNGGLFVYEGYSTYVYQGDVDE